MSANRVLLIIIFLVGINLLIAGILFKNQVVFYVGLIGLVNFVVLLFLIGEVDLSSMKSLFPKPASKLTEDGGMVQETEVKETDSGADMYKIVRFYNSHYVIVIVLFLMIGGIFEKLFLSTTSINLGITAVIFVLSIIISKNDIINKDIYFGQRRFQLKDFVFVISIVIIIGFFQIISNVAVYLSLFLSILLGFVFYTLSILVFGLHKDKYIFQSKLFMMYLFTTFLSFLYFAWNIFPKVQEKFVIERVVYVDNVVYKGGITNDELGMMSEKNDKLGMGSGESLSGDVDVGSNGTGDITLSGDIDDQLLTYRDVVPYIVEKYNLLDNVPSKPVHFKHITTDDDIYKYFKAAYYHKMFGKGSDPIWNVRCQNLVVLIGLAQKWQVTYSSKDVFEKFWEAGEKKGLDLSGCTMKGEITWDVLKTVIGD